MPYTTSVERGKSFMYTPEEQQKIEQVITVFREYWQKAANAYGQPLCDIVWLENMQCYVLMLNYSMTAKVNEKDLFAIPIQTAEELFTELIHELVHEIYSKYNLEELQKEEVTEDLLGKVRNEITENLSAYIQALPEYKNLAIQTLKSQEESYIDSSKLLLFE